MDDPAAPHTERPSRPPHRRRWLALGLGAVVLVAALGITLSSLLASASAPGTAFRFEQTYVGITNESRNVSAITISMWYTNTHSEPLRGVRIVMVAIDQGRNVAVDRAEHSLGDLRGKTSFESAFPMSLNSTRAYRIDVLVLADGMIVATAVGQVGFQPEHRPVYLLHDVDMEAQLSVSGDFAYEYRG